MRYSLDTDIPSEVVKISKVYLNDFIQFLIEKGKIRSKTATRLQLCSVALKVFFNNIHKHVINNKDTMTITLRPNSYSKGYICNGRESKDKVSYQYTVWLFEYLESVGLGGVEKGGVEFETFKSKGKWSYRVAETKKSIYTIPNKFKEDMKELTQVLTPQRNVIVLRDKDKNDVTFRLPKMYAPIKNTLVEANKWLINTRITDPVNSKVYPLQLVKIFNTNFNKGGRMYDFAIQSLSKQERHRLLIDGKETCVYDFKAFETSLIYSLQGEVMEGDPYKVTIEGYKPSVLREVGKMIMTRIYYSKCREELNASVSKDIAEKFNLDRMVEDGDIPERRIPVGQIIDLLIDKHEVIMEHFFGNSDYDPSNIGSRVMDYILEYMIQNYKTAVIPVFDEVICDKEFEYEVHDVMKKAYIHVVGSDTNCKIVKEK